jgi:hypothetical protein
MKSKKLSAAQVEVMRARGRLKNARQWFAHLGWDVLPKTERGRRILQWAADHACLASPTNPERSVRRWCRKWAPWCDPDRVVDQCQTSNKRWSDDQSATVLGITLSDKQSLGLQFIGASDDPDFDQRRETARIQHVERNRRYRAKKSTGRKRGRPRLEGVPAWQAAGFGSRATYYRHKAAERETENPRRHISYPPLQRHGIKVSRAKKRHGVKVPPSTSNLVQGTGGGGLGLAAIAAVCAEGLATVNRWG